VLKSFGATATRCFPRPTFGRLTTFRNYGHVETRRQCEIIAELASPNAQPTIDDRTLRQFLQEIQELGGR